MITKQKILQYTDEYTLIDIDDTKITELLNTQYQTNGQ